ncbi:uncharacterized protein [Antedon mediterranea]|uniref:uncharacterized protein n=1 Tax=Antedon mediterranea TaxID=105859 RepID=UPI003AF873B9
MWWYTFAHVVYHLIRWFPKNNRLKIRIVIVLFSFGLLFPQLFVLSREHSTRYCGQHLFDFLIVSIVFTFFMIGFSFIFSLMDPVPWEVKLAFHIFGVIAFVMGLTLTVFASLAVDCRNNTLELYYLSVSAAVLTVTSFAFLMVMIPFWLLNYFFPNSVLNRKERTGVCYEPTACCSCLWHI